MAVTESPEFHNLWGKVGQVKGLEHDIATSKPKAPTGWAKAGGLFQNIETLGQDGINKDYQDNLKSWAIRGASALGTAGATQIAISQRGATLEKQAADEQKQFQDEAAKKMAAIEKQTPEEFQRGLYNGQTIQEIASAQRAKRLGFVAEGANQQKAALYAQNQFSQQQEQMQGRQEQLRTQQLTGARGIGGSSVEDQILASQQQGVVNKQAQSQEQLGQGLFTVNEQTAKQTAEINAEVNKDQQQRLTDMQNAMDTQNKAARQSIIDKQQADISKVQNAYAAKRVEIDEMTRQVASAIQSLTNTLTG